MSRITMEDAVHYYALSDVYTSKDGKIILYQTHRPILEKNGYEDKEWIRTEKGTSEFSPIHGAPFFLNSTSFVYAVSEGSHRTELFQYDEKGKITGVAVIPYKASVIGVLSDGGIVLKARVNVSQKRRAEGKSDTDLQKLYEEMKLQEEDCMIMDEFPYWHDGDGLTNGVRNILFLYNREEGLVQLTEDLFDVNETAFDRADDSLYFTGVSFKTQRPLGTGLYRIDFRDRKPGLQAEAELKVSPEQFRFNDIVWNDETEELIAVGQIPGESREPGLYRLQFEAEKRSVQSDLNVFEKTIVKAIVPEFELSYGASILTDILLGGGRTLQTYDGNIFFLGTEREAVKVFEVDRNGNISAAVDNGGVVHDFTVSDEGVFYTALKGLDHSELYLKRNDRGTEKLTRYNDAHWADKKTARMDRLSYKDQYGFDIVGFVLHPVSEEEEDTGKKQKSFPAILDIHGGPSDAYGPVYNHEMQYWASHGYYVFWCNPTGSTGGGKGFGEIRGGTGGSDYEDIMGFTDLVLKRYPGIDPARVGVTGGSYGGFMTNWIIGHTDRFAAAASCRSTANNITEAANKDIAPFFIRSMTEPDAPDRFEKLWELSPLKYIDKTVTKTPTIFLHSLQDYRCYHVESLQMYAALQYIGVPTRMVLFKDESHGLSRNGHPRNRLRRLREITAWMDRYLNPDTEHVEAE